MNRAKAIGVFMYSLLVITLIVAAMFVLFFIAWSPNYAIGDPKFPFPTQTSSLSTK